MRKIRFLRVCYKLISNMMLIASFILYKLTHETLINVVSQEEENKKLRYSELGS